jgi:hypothetical protein
MNNQSVIIIEIIKRRIKQEFEFKKIENIYIYIYIN